MWNGIALTEVLDDYAETEDFFSHSAIGLIAGTAAGLLLARNPIEAGDASRPHRVPSVQDAFAAHGCSS